MAKPKRYLFNFPDLYRQDKMDDYIFAYFTGVKDVLPTAKLQDIALQFQSIFMLSEDEIAMDIIIASYHRSLDKYNKYIAYGESFFKPDNLKDYESWIVQKQKRRKNGKVYGCND